MRACARAGPSGSAPVPIPPPAAAPPLFRTVPPSSPRSPPSNWGGWRPDCPVAPAELRRVDLDYVGFDGRLHRGELIVHETVVDDVVHIFGQLLRLGYPIERMRNVDRYAGAGRRIVDGRQQHVGVQLPAIAHSNSWSRHAYGMAIDSTH